MEPCVVCNINEEIRIPVYKFSGKIGEYIFETDKGREFYLLYRVAALMLCLETSFNEKIEYGIIFACREITYGRGC